MTAVDGADGRGWVRHGLRIGLVQARRQRRRIRSKPLLRLLQWFPIVIATLALVGRVPVPVVGSLWPEPGAYVYGQRFAAGARPAVLVAARGAAGVLFLLLVYGGILKEVDGDGDRRLDGLLTTVSTRAVVLGTVVETVAFVGGRVFLAVLAAAVAFGLGAGPLPAATLLVAGTLVLLTGTAVGFLAALAIQTVFARSETVRENKAVFGTPLAVVYFGLFVQFRRSSALLGRTPIGWYGDLGFVGSGAPVAAGHAAAAFAGSLLAVPAVVWAGTALARSVWFADPPHDESAVDEDGEGGRSLAGLGEAVVARVASRPTAAVARATWRRLAREPKALLFVALPVIVTLGAGERLTHLRPNALPMVIAVYGSTAVGMGVTLNPLGAEGASLPVTLTTPGGGRHLLHGYFAAMALPGTVLVAAATFLGGLVTVGLSLPAILGITALSAVLALASTAASLGIGALLPQFEGIEATSNSSVTVPRIEAMSLLLFVAVIAGLPALLGLFWSSTVAAAVGGSPLAGAVVGVALSLALAGAAGALGYRTAVRIVAGYELGES